MPVHRTTYTSLPESGAHTRIQPLRYTTAVSRLLLVPSHTDNPSGERRVWSLNEIQPEQLRLQQVYMNFDNVCASVGEDRVAPFVKHGVVPSVPATPTTAAAAVALNARQSSDRRVSSVDDAVWRPDDRPM